MSSPPVVWTIAGFDPSSGAGITADLQTFAAHGLYGVSAITALTVQSTRGVAAVEPVAPALLRHMLEHLEDDVPPAGIKIGMLGSAAAVRTVADFLKERVSSAGKTKPIPVVLDPVLRSSSGAVLLDDEGLAAMQAELLEHVNWITPNQTELGVLSGRVIRRTDDVPEAMETVAARHPHLHCVVTGGDADGAPIDLWRAPDGNLEQFSGGRILTRSTHGTGCAFSSALLSLIVQGKPPADAVAGAKAFVEGGLRNAPDIGTGRGPMDLLWPLRRQESTGC